jgi:hypothetical protein
MQQGERHGSVVITIHFPRFVFLTCGSSPNARAGTHRRDGTGHGIANAREHESSFRKLLTSGKRFRAVLKLVINVADERVAITFQKEKWKRKIPAEVGGKKVIARPLVNSYKTA